MSIEATRPQTWLLLGAVNGFLSVALGAFAAHGLSGSLSERFLDAFEKGVDYQAMHALALLAIGILTLHRPDLKALHWSGLLFTGGIVLFSGSLYTLALSGIGILGAITPLGGSAFLTGWLALAWAAGKMGDPAS